MLNVLKQHGFEGSSLKAVLFDMDGVLFDSMPNHVSSWRQAVRPFGLELTEEEVYLNEGRTGSGTIQVLAQRFWGRQATEEECQAIYEAKSTLFNACPEALPMAGALEAVEAVRQAGWKRVVVTGSGQHSLLDRLNETFPLLFSSDLMVTAFDVTHGKPHPEPYLRGLQKAGIRATEALVVENAPLGVESARAAGIFTIAVNTGRLSDEVLRQAGANWVLPDMHTLAQVIHSTSITSSRSKE